MMRWLDLPRRALPRLGGAAIAALIALSGCKVDTTPTPTQVSATIAPTATATPPPVILKINLGRPPVSIDPALIAPLDISGNDLAANLFAGLALLDGDTGEVKPLLAKSWQTSDQVTWQVSLRDDVPWVRINPDTGQLEKERVVKASDVVAAARRACRADTNAPMLPAALLIKGCAEVHDQDPAALTDDFIAKTLAVSAPNDTEVDYVLTAPAAYFPTLLTMPALAPIPEEMVAQQKENWTRPDNLWTSGPFTVRPGVPPEQGYALVANTFWPVERTGNVSGLEIVFDPAAEQSFAALSSGDMALTTLPASQLARVSFEDPQYRLLMVPKVTMLVMSYDTPPFDNPGVRHAFALALDKQAIIKSVLAPQGVAGLPAVALVPPGSAGAPDYNTIGAPADPSAAQQALAKAGYSRCARLPSVSLLTDDSAISKLLATEYIRQWSAVLGCPEGIFKIDARPLGDVGDILRSPSTSRTIHRDGLATLVWQADYPDSYHWLADILGCRDKFPSAYLNQARPCTDVDDGLLRAASTAAPADRAALYKSIENALFAPDGEMPVIPIFYEGRALAIGPKLEVYPVHAGPLRFDQWVKGE